MIWESYPWRRELLRRAVHIENRKRQRRWHESSFAAFEMDVMLSAYAVRKMIEAQTKVPHGVSNSTVAVTRYPLRHQVQTPDLMNWDQVDRWYDLNGGQNHNLSAKTLCDLIIHSWVFVPTLDSDTRGLDGFFVNSDRTRSNDLYGIDIDSFLELLRRVATEEVAHLGMERDEDGQWVVTESLSAADLAVDAQSDASSEHAGPHVSIEIDAIDIELSGNSHGSERQERKQ